MDSFEWNKIAGALLFALLLSVGVKIISDTLFESEAPETPGIVIAVATEGGDANQPAAQPLPVLLASADPKAGATSAKKCGACHTFESGGPNKIGPNLYGVVNRPIASHPGFEYSDAMKQHAADAKTWTFENLNVFVHDPKGTVPGTKMTFAGLKDDKERANVLVYLNTLSDSPAPLPAPTEAASAEGGTETASAEAPATDTSAAPAAAQPEAPAEQTAQAETPAAAPAAGTTSAAAGDAKAGAAYAKRCTVCHSLDKDGPNRIGPHLYGVVGRVVASVPDFAYSPAMKEFSAGGTKTWDEATLSNYLTDPRGVVPGTKMVFPGIPSEGDRANVIAFLKTLVE